MLRPATARSRSESVHAGHGDGPRPLAAMGVEPGCGPPGYEPASGPPQGGSDARHPGITTPRGRARRARDRPFRFFITFFTMPSIVLTLPVRILVIGGTLCSGL